MTRPSHQKRGKFFKPANFPQMLMRQVLETRSRPGRFHVAIYDIETQKKLVAVPFYVLGPDSAIEVAIEREPLSEEEFRALEEEISSEETG